jgi:hypothetical protein
MALVGLCFLACEEDQTGPDKENTPAPPSPTPPEAPTPTITPTPAPSYEGGWYGIIQTTYPDNCPDIKFIFSINNGVAKGHFDCWIQEVGFPYYPMKRSFEFEAQVADSAFRFYYWWANYQWEYDTSLRIVEGTFRSETDIYGSWEFDDYAFEYDHDYRGLGVWFAWKVN